MLYRSSNIRCAWLSLVIVAVIALSFSIFSSPSFAQPQQPQVLLDTTYTLPGGKTISVSSGGDFQAALNNAQPGDIISLQAGATFSGNFTLPNKAGFNWIVIRTSAPDSSLPPQGTRITPAYSTVMPKIVSPNTSSAISTNAATSLYRFLGVEITTTYSSTAATLYNLINLEAAGGQTSLSQAPNNIIFDRCYIHGTASGNVRRGIALNSARTAIVDSYLSDFHEIGADSQAIAGWNGPGPFKIVNNHLEAAAENVLFGGADPSIANLVPSDIEIRDNHFFKPLSWKVGDPSYGGIHWEVKNILELKNAQRLLIQANIFEYKWPDAQNGFSVLFTVRNQDGSAPWSVVQDVTFKNNLVRHVAAAINILGWDDLHPSQQAQRLLIENNLFDDVGNSWSFGRLFQILNGAANITIDHNTAFQTENVVMADGSADSGFVFTNNIAPHNAYGVTGTGTGSGTNTLNTYFPGYVFLKNVLPGGTVSLYPTNNYFPPSLSDVGFVNLAGGNYQLLATSPYLGAGTDGKDIGADFNALNTAIAGVIAGTAGDPVSTVNPPPATGPVISSVSVSNISASGATINWTTNEATDSQVIYGTTTAYGSSTTLNTTKVTSHSQTLTGLARDTS